MTVECRGPCSKRLGMREAMAYPDRYGDRLAGDLLSEPDDEGLRLTATEA